MRPHLQALASRQCGLVTRRQAVEAGYTERELRTLTAVGGAWVVVRRGVYVERTLWDALDVREGQWSLRDRAADLTMAQSHVMSHDSAARSWGLPLLDHELVHVTRPGVRGSRTEHAVKHHLDRRLTHVVERDGLRVTGLARTVLDLGREHGLSAGVVACDAARRTGLPLVDLRDELSRMRSWPGITRARAAVDVSDPGAETAGESLMRLLLLELGLGTPRTQVPLLVEGRLFWTDVLVGRHVFEFDGRTKYRSVADGGVATRSAEDVVWAEKERERLICSLGLGLSRVIWSDFWGRARSRAKERLRAEFANTCARFGDTLPEHLEREARHLGRRFSA